MAEPAGLDHREGDQARGEGRERREARGVAPRRERLVVPAQHGERRDAPHRHEREQREGRRPPRRRRRSPRARRGQESDQVTSTGSTPRSRRGSASWSGGAERSAQQAAGEADQERLHQVRGEHAGGARAQAAQHGDRRHAPLDEDVDGARDAEPAEQQRHERHEAQEVAEARERLAEPALVLRDGAHGQRARPTAASGSARRACWRPCRRESAGTPRSARASRASAGRSPRRARAGRRRAARSALRTPTSPGALTIVARTTKRASPIAISSPTRGAEHREQRGLDDRAAALGEPLPLAGRRRLDRSVERIPGLDGEHLREPRRPRRRAAGHRAEARRRGRARPRAASPPDSPSERLGALAEGPAADRPRSAPSSERASRSTDARRLSVKELIATSAATPIAIAATSSSPRRFEPRASRHGQRENEARPSSASDTTAPSRSRSTRCARAASSGSWVTSTTRRAELAVELRQQRRPRCGRSRRRGCPVGSSANSSFGPVHEGARHRHALLLAARELGGVVVAAVAEPDALAAARPPRSRGSSPRSSSGTWTFSSAVRVGIRWNDWNTKPTARGAQPRALVLVEARRGPGRRAARGPLVGRSSPASRPRSVLLPLPEGPVIARMLSGLELERDISEDGELAPARG